MIASSFVRQLLPYVLATLLCSCAGARAEPEAPVTTAASADAGEEAASPPPAADAPHDMPTACAQGDPSDAGGAAVSICTPPSDFVDRLCDGNYLDAALVLFQKDSPWTRGYLRMNVDAWYASGGASARTKLEFDEEVLVLRFRAPGAGSIIVGTGGSYDVLRWDGGCYTLDSGELTMHHPPKAKRPSIPFQHIGPRLQEALLADPKVKAAYAKRGKECQGVTRGDVSLACVKADAALSAAVADFVRSNELPEPSRVP